MNPTETIALFQKYFSREVAEKAAKSLSNGAEIEFRIEDTLFTLKREQKRNLIVEGPAIDPQLVFVLTPKAAELILQDTATDLGQIGVNILKLIWNDDALTKVHIEVKAGFFSLFSKGYFGVLTSGGAGLASLLASKGFNGMGAFKKLLKK